MIYLAFLFFVIIVVALTIRFKQPSAHIETLYQLEQVHLIAVENCVFFIDGERELFYFSGLYFYKFSEIRGQWIKTIDNFDPLKLHQKQFDLLIVDQTTLPKKYLPTPKI
jgi:hypothetical protein